MSKFRTDRHNNPAAITDAVAWQAKLEKGKDYERGDPFTVGGKTYYTARLLGDPVETTIRVIDAVGFHTLAGSPRWYYNDAVYEKIQALLDGEQRRQIQAAAWQLLNPAQRKQVIGTMYKHEGGTDLKKLFT